MIFQNVKADGLTFANALGIVIQNGTETEENILTAFRPNKSRANLRTKPFYGSFTHSSHPLCYFAVVRI